MNHILRDTASEFFEFFSGLLIILLAFVCAASAPAGPIEDARAAYVRRDFATAIRIIRPLAEQGNAIAQYNLGYMYAHGQGVLENDIEAIKWLQRAAEQGYDAAYYSLGVMHEHGQGVVQDYVQAYAWFSLAAASVSASESRRRKNAVSVRDKLAAKMSTAQIAQEQKLAREWKPKKN